MPDITGTVNDFEVKSGISKKTNKPYTMYNLVVDGQKYGFGFNAPQPTPKQGDLVKIRYDEVQNGQYTNRNITNFRIEKDAANNPDKGNVKVPSGGGEMGAAWGNASNVAAQLIAQMALVDALPLTAAKGKANNAKRFDEFLETFDKLRVKLFKDSQDIQRVLDEHADFGEVETNEPPALPDGAVDEADDFEEESDDDWDDDVPF